MKFLKIFLPVIASGMMTSILLWCDVKITSWQFWVIFLVGAILFELGVLYGNIDQSQKLIDKNSG